MFVSKYTVEYNIGVHTHVECKQTLLGYSRYGKCEWFEIVFDMN